MSKDALQNTFKNYIEKTIKLLFGEDDDKVKYTPLKSKKSVKEITTKSQKEHAKRIRKGESSSSESEESPKDAKNGKGIKLKNRLGRQISKSDKE